VLSSPR